MREHQQTVNNDSSSFAATPSPLPLPKGEGEVRVVMVKTRSTQSPVAATIKKLENGRAEVILEEADFAVAAGQACVAYIGDVMIGGGWIMG